MTFKPSNCDLVDAQDKIRNCFWQNYYLTKGYVLVYGKGEDMKWYKLKEGEKPVYIESKMCFMLGDIEVIMCKEYGIDFDHMHHACGTEKLVTYT